MTNLPVNSEETRAAARHRITWVLALLCGLTSPLTIAQERFLVEGIFDAEFYQTDANSIFLSRNEGDIATLGRLQLWSAFQISPGFQIYALGEFEADNSSGEGETESEIEQFALRYSSQSAPYYFLEAGKILSPLGAYSNRHLSTQNPLIGQPYVYITSYPWGIQAAGSSGSLDYRAALLDQPDINPGYIPFDPDSAFRPALGFGVTPFTGLRFGLSYTEGPYLNRQLGAYLPPGTDWRDFDQRILGFDVQFSRGYLELNGQYVVSKYDVPFRSERTDDTSYYIELKYTWTPRIYGAVRFEKNEAAFISHPGDLSWLAQSRKFRDVEVGIGYRFSPDTQLKVAYRRDHWDSHTNPENSIRNGYSLALQLSHHFDLRSWSRKKP
jgi:hypothetical protein